MSSNNYWLKSKKSEIESINFHRNPSVVSYIVIHHSLTYDGKEVNWEAIRKFHTSYRYAGKVINEITAKSLIEKGLSIETPWSDIGYHFGVERVDDDYKIMLGRPLDKRGAHVGDGGFNRMSIGICVVGNFDKTMPSDKQWLTTLIFVNHLRQHLINKHMNIPIENIIGHREAQQIAGVDKLKIKSCPGSLFDMDLFRKDLINYA